MAERLDRPTMEVVRKAWNSIIQNYKQDPVSNEFHFTDNETDVGFLKDVDALNALVEPFILAPTSFVDPPVKVEELVAMASTLLSKIKSTVEPGGPVYRGFSATPYPYFQAEIDFVDSAASVLRLNANLIDLFEATKKSLPKEFDRLLQGTSRSAIDFLLEACIEDKNGARWPAFIKASDSPGIYANLFFTNNASLALARALENSVMKSWLGQERKERIESILSKVASWAAQQYNPATSSFWMDESKTSLQNMGILYALEVIYGLVDPLPENIRKNCADALASIVGKMTDLSTASSLQRDFFHSIPLPSGPGNIFYDDRRYIGAFLGLFARAKTADPDVMDDTFFRASEVLFQGVSDDWIDDASSLWDDGRPLVCFSQDSLIGLVQYSLEGKADVVNLPDFELRAAIRESLKSDSVIDAIFDTLLEKSKIRRNQELTKRLEGRA
jgi:hypothetical protein